MYTSHRGHREPNVGPWPAQKLRIFGFVNSKTDGKNATVLSQFLCDLKKKKSSGKHVTVFSGFRCDLQNKKRSSVFHILISQCHFDGPSEAHGPSAEPPEANEPHDEPPKVHEPWGHCPPAPPLSLALLATVWAMAQ